EQGHHSVVDPLLQRPNELARTDVKTDRGLPEREEGVGYREFDRRSATSVAATRTAPAAVSICTNRENGRVKRSTSALGSVAGICFTSRSSAIEHRRSALAPVGDWAHRPLAARIVN